MNAKLRTFGSKEVADAYDEFMRSMLEFNALAVQVRTAIEVQAAQVPGAVGGRTQDGARRPRDDRAARERRTGHALAPRRGPADVGSRPRRERFPAAWVTLVPDHRSRDVRFSTTEVDPGLDTDRLVSTKCRPNSTSWGSLVGAQYRPPQKPAQTGVSLSCKTTRQKLWPQNGRSHPFCGPG